MQQQGSRNLLVVLDLRGEQGLKPVAGFSDSDIDDVHWVDDDRLVFDFRDSEEGSGERRRGAGLFVVKRNGEDMKPLIRLEHVGIARAGSRLDDRNVLHPNHWLLHVPGIGGNEVIVGEGKWDSRGALESVLPKRLDISTGRSRPVASNAPPFARRWWFDSTGEPRITTVTRDGRSRVFWRAPGQEDWKEIGNFADFEEPWWPHSVDGDGRLWVDADEASSDTRVLKRFDFVAGRPEDGAVIATPGFSVTGSLVSETRGSRTLGVRVDTDAETTVWFDARLREFQDMVDKRLPGRVNRLARQGEALPTVVLVHGGPWVRGRRWRWDADVQFLASRGYLVIEPEFRGSTGYGGEHFRAGWRQWGQAMQDDVADALLWAVKQGQADAKRACIAGASYGGYATLMGLVKQPELYRCGIAWAAVTDPTLMFTSRWSDVSEQSKRYGYARLIGHPERDAESFKANSPLMQASRIKAPVLLAMGQLDQRVPLEHGTRMRDALKSLGNEPEWVEYPLEGHGWNLLETRLDFAARMERFLAQHLR